MHQRDGDRAQAPVMGRLQTGSCRRLVQRPFDRAVRQHALADLDHLARERLGLVDA